jgi:hypothetical protein
MYKPLKFVFGFSLAMIFLALLSWVVFPDLGYYLIIDAPIVFVFSLFIGFELFSPRSNDRVLLAIYGAAATSVLWNLPAIVSLINASDRVAISFQNLVLPTIILFVSMVSPTIFPLLMYSCKDSAKRKSGGQNLFILVLRFTVTSVISAFALYVFLLYLFQVILVNT